MTIGNTITGVEHSERYAEYLSPDGRILGRAESGQHGVVPQAQKALAGLHKSFPSASVIHVP